jgi:hypothetical protein
VTCLCRIVSGSFFGKSQVTRLVRGYNYVSMASLISGEQARMTDVRLSSDCNQNMHA